MKQRYGGPNMDDNRKRFLILGLGPAGGILAAFLSAAGHAVHGVDIWEEHVARIRADGLRITGLYERTAVLEEIQTSIATLEHVEFDYVVVAIKASMMSHVIPDIMTLGGNFKAVALQNGIETEEILAKQFGSDRTMRVIVNYAGVIDAPGILRMTFFNRPNYVGCLCDGRPCERTREFAAILTDGGLDTEITGDLQKSTWRKTILNAALTPVCALLDMTMAQVMACPETYQLVESILEESLTVASACGHDFGEGYPAEAIAYLSGAGDHRPSMLRDLKNGRPTEIDFINGKIMLHGLRLGVPVPINSTLRALVKTLESKSLRREKT
ncbi:MAG: ketopantoate reductase family protein [Pseudomonadota bacterium]